MFEIELLTSEIVKKIDCPGCFDHAKISLKNDSKSRSCVMIMKFMELFAEKVKNMEVYDDDIWVITFPKAGTTFTQELCWLINNDLNYEKAFEVNLNDRFPFLELHGVLNKFDGDSVGNCSNLSRPRHIKSHLPISLLPDKLWTVKPKIIYVARNPKDVAISFFHHYRHIVGYEGTKNDFLNAFLSDQLIYGSYNEHVLDFWKMRNEPNLLFLFYEDMKRNLPGVIAQTMKFFNKEFVDEEIRKLSQHLSVESMRQNPSCNNDSLVKLAKSLNDNGKSSGVFKFIRQGKIGSYKTELSEEFDKKFEDYMHAPLLLKNNFSYKI